MITGSKVWTWAALISIYTEDMWRVQKNLFLSDQANMTSDS